MSGFPLCAPILDKKMLKIVFKKDYSQSALPLSAILLISSKVLMLLSIYNWACRFTKEKDKTTWVLWDILWHILSLYSAVEGVLNWINWLISSWQKLLFSLPDETWHTGTGLKAFDRQTIPKWYEAISLTFKNKSICFENIHEQSFPDNALTRECFKVLVQDAITFAMQSEELSHLNGERMKWSLNTRINT